MFYQKSIERTCEELKIQTNTGLSEAEAAQRLETNGPNALVEKKPRTMLQMFLAQLNDPMIFILFAAVAISVLLREYKDSIIILAIIVINAVIGVVQEGKAQRALEALKKLSSPTALVRRGNMLREVPAAELVAGDVVILEAGRQVPADLRLIFSTNLKIEESALTGESVPSEKDAAFVSDEALPLGDRRNMAYMTTSVSYGRGEGVVAATGMDTEIGKIAQIINATEMETTPLQKRLSDLGKLIGIIAIVLCVALFAIAVLQKREILEMLLTAISLAVAAVPEGLPAIVTIVLALGVQRLVKVNTIVRRLPSVETLGSVSVVCSDKTGTLTQNRMTVTHCYADQELFEAGQLDLERHRTFLTGFALCNDASLANGQRFGDPTEIALLDMAATRDLSRQALEERSPRIGELPFDSTRKMMSTLHRTGEGTIAYTKGAPDEVLRRCTHILTGGERTELAGDMRGRIYDAVRQMSLQALRVLALACSPQAQDVREEGLTFVGLAGMIDPPRPEAAPAVQVLKGASIRTVMITGDHVDTAFAIAKQLDIAERADQCITGAQLDELTPESLAERIDNLRVFARVSPEHKVMIVAALRARGYIVSMTGDGVNDAPSLQSADIGVAMGIAGTDVAKSAADMVLTDDNFATIQLAVQEGRGIYDNIKKSVLFLLSSNFGEIITMFLSILVGLAAPLRAIHILWVNLITDSLPALSLGVDKNDGREMMSRPPRDPKESLFAGGGLFLTIFYGSVIALITLGAFVYAPYAHLIGQGARVTLSGIAEALSSNAALLMRAQTYAFTTLGISQLFHALGMRSVTRSFFRLNHLENRMMILAFAVGFALQIAITTIPAIMPIFGTVQLSAVEWLWLTVLSSAPLWVHELMVPVFRRWRRRKTA